tara:strand:- start:30558 stop:31661 length:1104 start_codon:yes stop_codon:yes gene_type:complete
MHLNLLKKMHDERSVVLISYDTQYLESKLKELNFSVHKIDATIQNNFILLKDEEKLSTYLKKIQLTNEKNLCIYGSGLEGKNEVYPTIENHLEICGNSLNIIEKCGYIKNIASDLAIYNLSMPKTYELEETIINKSKKYIYKPKNSCGGYDITHDSPRSSNFYLQELIVGDAYSCSFVIQDNNFIFLGFNKLINLEDHSHHPFIHAGAISIDNCFSEELLTSIKNFSLSIDLTGYNSIDFIHAEENSYIIDINPRITSTFRMYNDFYENELLKGQIQGYYSKCILEKNLSKCFAFVHVYARQDFVFKHDQNNLEFTINLPNEGDLITQGSPIFTIVSEGENYHSNLKSMQSLIKITKKYYDIYDILL